MRKLVLLVALVTLGACTDKPTSAECESLLANAVNVELRGRGIAEDKLEKRSAKVAELARDEYLDQCMKTMTGARVRCGIAAQNRAALEECDAQGD